MFDLPCLRRSEGCFRLSLIGISNPDCWKKGFDIGRDGIFHLGGLVHVIC